MAKVNHNYNNDFCPQTLFLYGTKKEDGTPDFGLFCWFSYVWDSELGVMACIGGSKLTRDNIHKRKVFSANLVTEKLLPLADFLGNTAGGSPEKMSIEIRTEQGRVLPVPVLTDAPVSFELEVKQFIPLDGGEVMLCRIRNVLQDDFLAQGPSTAAEKLAAIAPVHTTCHHYFGWDGRDLGAWGEPMGKLFTKQET